MYCIIHSKAIIFALSTQSKKQNKMKTKMNLEENITWNFVKRTLYALQVIIIAMAIPVLSYLELSHVQKAESPTIENRTLTIAQTDATALTLK